MAYSRTLLACVAVSAVTSPVAARAQASSPATAPAPVAQTAADGAVEDIVVTAQRREQNLARVPLAISAFSEKLLKETKSETIIDLAAYAPSFKAFTLGSGFPRFYMRGVGSNDFNIGSDLTIGIFVDDTYVGRGATAVTDLADVRRVEVLRGPQGALFGRSTIGGAISVITNPPEFAFSGAVEASYGSTDQRRAHAMINVPLIDDKLAVRLNATLTGRGGYITNLFNGQKLGGGTGEAFRGAIRFEPNDRLSINLKADYSHDIDDGTVQRSNSIAPFVTAVFGVANTNVGYHQQISNLPRGRDGQFQEREVWGGQLRLDYDLDWATLTSISLYRGYKLDFAGDYDGTALPALVVSVGGGNDQYNQELRATSSGTGRFSWIVGANYGYENVTQYSIYDIGFPILSIITKPANGPFPTFPPGFTVRNDTFARGRYTNVSVFGDLTYAITDKLKAIVSARYSHDNKKFNLFTPGVPQFGGVGLVFNRVNPALDREKSYSNFSPRLTLSYQASPDVMVFATAAQGYKPGGFNSTSTVGDLISPFGSETVRSYEGGIRAGLFDNRVRASLTGYYYKYDGLQVFAVQDQTGIIVVRNGKASGRGIEGELTGKVVNGLTLSGSFAYTDARYDDFSTLRGGKLVSFAGNRAVYAPELAFTVGATYERELSGVGVVALRADYNYTGRQFFDPDNAPFNTEPAYGMTNIRIALRDRADRRSIAFVGRNIFDVHYRVRTNAGTEAVGFPLILDGLPPFYGAEVSFKF